MDRRLLPLLLSAALSLRADAGDYYLLASDPKDHSSMSGTGSAAGWATTPGGAVRYKDGQSVRNLCATANGTATLYAKWQGVEYKVVLSAFESYHITIIRNARFCSQQELGLVAVGLLDYYA